MPQEKNGRLPLIGAVISAVAASACCIGPLLLVMLGIGGAWAGSLTVMEPFRPYFLGAAAVFLFFAWKKVYARQLPAYPALSAPRRVPKRAQADRGEARRGGNSFAVTHAVVQRNAPAAQPVPGRQGGLSHYRHPGH